METLLLLIRFLKRVRLGQVSDNKLDMPCHLEATCGKLNGIVVSTSHDDSINVKGILSAVDFEVCNFFRDTRYLEEEVRGLINGLVAYI